MIHIRPSTSADSARAVEIRRDAVDATHGFLPETPLWLAVDANDRAIASMLLDGAGMEALFIDPAHRGTGVGLVRKSIEPLHKAYKDIS